MQPICETFEAGVDLSAKQYLFVTQASDGQIDPTGDGAFANGVLQNNPDAAGKAAQVAILGVTRVKAGAAFEEGVLLGSDASGKAVTATSGEYILAVSKQAAGADGDIVIAQLILSGAKVA
jgi:hypothetical protein